MRILAIIVALAVIPAVSFAEERPPTAEQRAYFARQMKRFAQHIENSASARTSLQCDSVDSNLCLELAARSFKLRDELIGQYDPKRCLSLGDFEQLKCLSWVKAQREERLKEWDKEWRSGKPASIWPAWQYR